MARRGDGIHKRRDGRWEGRYAIGRNENGTIRYASVYAGNYADVKEKLQKLKTQPKPAPVSIPDAASDLTFAEVAKRWLTSNSVRLKPSTLNKYAYLLDTHIVPQIGAVSLSKLNTDVINQFLKEKLDTGRIGTAGGLSPSYVAGIRMVVLSVFRFSAEQGLCSSVMGQIYRPQQHRKDIVLLSKPDQHLLEAYIRGHPSGAGIGVLLSMYTGLRIGEVCALRWEDVDLQQAIIHIRHTVCRIQNVGHNGTVLVSGPPKTQSSYRDIPIPSPLFSLLHQHSLQSLSAYVASESENFVSPRTLDARFQNLLKRSGLSHINFHALRHTFATRCIEAGVDIKSLSEILGHANVAITLNTYVHSSMETKREQLRKLTDVLCNG